MTRTTSSFALWTLVLAVTLGAHPAGGGVLDQLLLASEIRSLRAKVDAGEPLDSQSLEHAIAEGSTAGLDLARAVLAYNRSAIREGRAPIANERAEGLTIYSALMNGLSRRAGTGAPWREGPLNLLRPTLHPEGSRASVAASAGMRLSRPPRTVLSCGAPEAAKAQSARSEGGERRARSSGS